MRLIDADALIEKFNEKTDMGECLIDARTAERFATFCALADAVEEMPTVDAIVVKLYNNSDEPYTVRMGDKITQLVILPIYAPELELVETFEETERGSSGFGSTGR